MKATTIKVEGELLEALERRKPATETLTGFVKSILRRELLRQELAESARRYAEFVAEHADEKAELAEWEAARLETAPAARRRR